LCCFVLYRALLKEQGLSLGGKKSDLVKRLREGVPTLPIATDVSYEWDPTHPTKKTFFTSLAPSSKGNCIRCLRPVSQGYLRVDFETWDRQYGTFARHYHWNCFCTTPPTGINSFDDIKWGDPKPDTRDDEATAAKKKAKRNPDVCTEQIEEIKKSFIQQEVGEVTGQRETAGNLVGVRDATKALREITGLPPTQIVALTTPLLVRDDKNKGD
jgi:hypothetical protein